MDLKQIEYFVQGRVGPLHTRRQRAACRSRAHPTGYQIYRLEWQGMGGLQRRLRNCMTAVRAEPFAYGSDEYTALELYLMQRAAGMALEAPAVRP